MNRLTKNKKGTNPKTPQGKALKKAVKLSFNKVLAEYRKNHPLDRGNDPFYKALYATPTPKKK